VVVSSEMIRLPLAWPRSHRPDLREHAVLVATMTTSKLGAARPQSPLVPVPRVVRDDVSTPTSVDLDDPDAEALELGIALGDEDREQLCPVQGAGGA